MRIFRFGLKILSLTVLQYTVVVPIVVALHLLYPQSDLLHTTSTVLPTKNVRGRFPAFLAFKATDQRHIIILLFETLQFWFWCNFCGINQFWGTAPMDLKNQVRTKKIAKKSFFRLNFEVLLINSYFWNFLWSLQFAWILNYEFIKIL